MNSDTEDGLHESMSADPMLDDEEDEYERRPSSLERMVPELLRRGLEKGLEAGLSTLSRTDGALRGVVGDGRLPKELASYVLSQVDDTKKAILRVVAREVREVLRATDLKREVESALENLTVDVHTQIRFNRRDSDGSLEPEIKHNTHTQASEPTSGPTSEDGT